MPDAPRNNRSSRKTIDISAGRSTRAGSGAGFFPGPGLRQKRRRCFREYADECCLDDPEGVVKDLALDLACDLTLEHGVLVSVFVADRRFVEGHRGYSFLATVEAQGIRV